MTDIVSTIAHFLMPDVVERISLAAGLDRASGQMAIDAVVPAILSGLVELAGSPDGASRLAGAIAAQASDDLSALEGNPGRLTELEVKGSAMLPALLGESLVRRMAWIVGSYTGVGERSARILMSLLMPLIVAILGREQRATGSDVAQADRLLSSERREIDAAMPAGLTELLKVELSEEAGPRPSSLLRRSESASQRGSTMQQAMSDGAESDSTRGEWSAWALPVLVALGFVWWYSLIWWLLLPSSPPRVAETHRSNQAFVAATRKAGDAASALISSAAGDWISINTYFNKEIYNRSGERLGTIKDVLIGPDGMFNAAVVAVDHNRGLGDKKVAVPFAALHLEWRDSGARLLLDATRDALHKAPAFKPRPRAQP